MRRKTPKKRIAAAAVRLYAYGWLLLLAISVLVWGVPWLWWEIRLADLQYGGCSIAFTRKSLHSENPDIRQAAAGGLGEYGREATEAVPELMALLDDPSCRVAANAAWSLGEIRAPRRDVIQKLTATLSHPDGEVRRYAAYALWRCGIAANSATPELLKKLDDEHMGYMAARALSANGADPTVVTPRLTSLLTSPSPASRGEAAIALSKHAQLPPRTVAMIEKLANDEEEVVRACAKVALNNLGVKRSK